MLTHNTLIGTDWSCEAKEGHDEERFKGFKVILLYAPNSQRQQDQIKGRAGRAGEPGAFQPIFTTQEIESMSVTRARSATKVKNELRANLLKDEHSGLMRSLVKYDTQNKPMAIPYLVS